MTEQESKERSVDVELGNAAYVGLFEGGASNDVAARRLSAKVVGAATARFALNAEQASALQRDPALAKAVGRALQKATELYRTKHRAPDSLRVDLPAVPRPTAAAGSRS